MAPSDQGGAGITVTKVLFARYRHGLAGETRRGVHAVDLDIVPSPRHAPSLIALCGLVLPRDEIELLDVSAGMPCEPCLALLIARDTTTVEQDPSDLPDLHPEVAALLTDLGHASVVQRARERRVAPRDGGSRLRQASVPQPGVAPHPVMPSHPANLPGLRGAASPNCDTRALAAGSGGCEPSPGAHNRQASALSTGDSVA